MTLCWSCLPRCRPLLDVSTSTGVAPPGGWRRCRCLLASDCTFGDAARIIRVRAPPKVAPYGGCQRMSHSAHALYLLACLLVNKPLRCIVLLGLPCSFLPQACTHQYQSQMRTMRVWLKPRPAVPSLRSCSPSAPPLASLHRRLDSQSRRKEAGGRIVVAAHTFHNLYAYRLLTIAFIQFWSADSYHSSIWH